MIEVVVSEVKMLQVRKMKSKTFGRNGTIKPATTEVKANHIPTCVVTHDPIP